MHSAVFSNAVEEELNIRHGMICDYRMKAQFTLVSPRPVCRPVSRRTFPASLFIFTRLRFNDVAAEDEAVRV